MSLSGRPLIPCGMYASSETLKTAWTSLLQDLPARLEGETSDDVVRAEVTFDTDDGAYESPDLLIGHTCGYPYIMKWRETHVAVATPTFDLPGCRGHEYSSWFVCRADDERDELHRFAGANAALNHTDSNSGMNVFRDAIKDIAGGKPFFDNVLVSGSHLDSMRMVIRGEADIAAIDSVTYHHALSAESSLAQGLRIFGQSRLTPGLPFIQWRSSKISPSAITDALNHSLRSADEDVRQTIGLTGFKLVSDSDYDVLAQMETEATRAGYPSLA